MHELWVKFVSADVLSQQSGSHFAVGRRDRFLRNRRARGGRSVALRTLRRWFDADERYQVTRQRPAPIQHPMIAVKFGVVDGVSFARECVSQITVSREECRVY